MTITKILFVLLLTSLIIFIIHRITVVAADTYTETTPSLIFFSGKQTQRFLNQDKDKFVFGLKEYEISERSLNNNTKSLESYKNQFKTLNFSEDQKAVLTKLTRRADEIFRKNKMNKIANMNWKFALTDGRSYENGLSHTRQNVIFLSNTIFQESSKSLIQTLLHEKMHVYQRYNQRDVVNGLKRRGINRFKKSIVSNPDTDGYEYTSMNQNLSSPHHRRHPFEEMSYQVENLV